MRDDAVESMRNHKQGINFNLRKSSYSPFDVKTRNRLVSDSKTVVKDKSIIDG